MEVSISEFEESLSGTKKVSRFLDRVNHYSIAVDVILTALIGIISNQLKFEGNNSGNGYVLLALVVVLIIYALIKFFQNEYARNSLSNNVDMPVLNLKVKLSEEKSRKQEQVAEYISSTLEKLNDATCNDLPIGSDPGFCSRDIDQGLTRLLTDFTNNITTILNTTCTKYQVGVFMNNVNSPRIDGKVESLLLEFNSSLFPDGFKEVLNNKNRNRGVIHEVETEVFGCLNNKSQKFKHLSTGHTIICTPIPNACERCTSCEMAGVLFVITESKLDENQFTPTIKYTLHTFTTIVANWVVRYNQCIAERLSKKNITDENQIDKGGKVKQTGAAQPFQAEADNFPWLTPTPTPCAIPVPSSTPDTMPVDQKNFNEFISKW